MDALARFEFIKAIAHLDALCPIADQVHFYPAFLCIPTRCMIERVQFSIAAKFTIYPR